MTLGMRAVRVVGKREHAAAIWAGNGTDAEKQAAIDEWNKPPGKRRNKPEHTFQMRVKQHLLPLIGPPGELNRLGVYFAMIDPPDKQSRKDESGRRFNVDGNLRKARGCVGDLSDMLVTWCGPNGGWIEFKAGYNQPTDGQKKFQESMRKQGFHVAVVWDKQGVDEVERLLRLWNCPLLGRTTA